MKKAKIVARHLKNIGRDMRIALLLFLASLKMIVDLATGVAVAIMLIAETEALCIVASMVDGLED